MKYTSSTNKKAWLALLLSITCISHAMEEPNRSDEELLNKGDETFLYGDEANPTAELAAIDSWITKKISRIVNKKRKDGKSPLHIATTTNNVETIKKYIWYGANPNIHDESGATPLDRALEQNNEVTVLLLLEHNANPNLRNKVGWTPLHSAVFFGRHTITKNMLEYGGEPNLHSFSKKMSPKTWVQATSKKLALEIGSPNTQETIANIEVMLYNMLIRCNGKLIQQSRRTDYSKKIEHTHKARTWITHISYEIDDIFSNSKKPVLDLESALQDLFLLANSTEGIQQKLSAQDFAERMNSCIAKQFNFYALPILFCLLTRYKSNIHIPNEHHAEAEKWTHFLENNIQNLDENIMYLIGLASQEVASDGLSAQDIASLQEIFEQTKKKSKRKKITKLLEEYNKKTIKQKDLGIKKLVEYLNENQISILLQNIKTWHKGAKKKEMQHSLTSMSREETSSKDYQKAFTGRATKIKIENRSKSSTSLKDSPPTTPTLPRKKIQKEDRCNSSPTLKNSPKSPKKIFMKVLSKLPKTKTSESSE